MDDVWIGALYLDGGILGPSRPNANDIVDSTEPRKIYAMEDRVTLVGDDHELATHRSYVTPTEFD